MEDLSIALVWLGFMASIVLGLYFYFSARHKERMALIEKNADVSEIFKPRQIQFRIPWLKLGIIIVGIGLGACLSVMLSLLPIMQNLDGDSRTGIVFGFMLVCGGIGIVIAHHIDKHKGE